MADPTNELNTDTRMSGTKPQTQQAIPDRERLFQTIIEQTADAIFVKDLQGRYVFVNPAITVMFEQPAEAMVGKDDAALFPPDVAQHLKQDDRQVIESGETQEFEETVVVEGSRRTFLNTKTPWRGAQGTILGVIGIAHDITERKKMADTQEAKMRQLESMNSVMMDREQRILELKERVKALEARLSGKASENQG